MTSVPRTSVVLCTRDGEKYIAEQLRSIRVQSAQIMELVLSDDDSSDRTLEIAQQALAGAQFSVLWSENHPALGITKNFESAIRRSSGDFVALSDQDDAWHPDKLTAALDVFRRDTDALLLFTDARLVDGAGKPLEQGLFESLRVSEAELAAIESGGAFPLLLRRNLVTGATVVFRRRLLDLALPFPVGWVHDEWLAMVAALHGGVRVLRRQTIDYRQHGSNQIGVMKPTLTYRVQRMLQSRGTRNEDLAQKFSELETRVEGFTRDRQMVAAVRAKARFERVRAAMPKARVARVPTVARLAVRGDYPRFASQGILDILRDLLQST
jgi:glycosyltransferase involved in cell wall biosynthesis